MTVGQEEKRINLWADEEYALQEWGEQTREFSYGPGDNHCLSCTSVYFIFLSGEGGCFPIFTHTPEQYDGLIQLNQGGNYLQVVTMARPLV